MQTIPVFGCFFVMCVTPLGAADETDSDKLARKAYLTFCQAYNKNELDGVMKVMDVPWLELGKPVVKDRIELQKIWKKLLADRSVESLPWTKFKVEPMSVLREAAKGNKDFLTKLERLGLTKEDRAVVDGIMIFIVRVRKGEAKILGGYPLGLKIHGKIFP